MTNEQKESIETVLFLLMSLIASSEEDEVNIQKCINILTELLKCI